MIPVLCRRSLSALPRASTAARAVLCSTTTLPPNVILAEEAQEESAFTPVDFNAPGAFELPVQGFGGGGDADRVDREPTDRRGARQKRGAGLSSSKRITRLDIQGRKRTSK